MDILKKNFAPITDKGWEEISKRIRTVLDSSITARNIVDIDGPNGFEFGGISTGKLIIPQKHEAGHIRFGIREMLPLVEVREPFEMELWELDDIERGARAVDFSDMDKIVSEFAAFENRSVYEGFTPGKIKGLKESSAHPAVKLPSSPDDFLKAVGKQTGVLADSAVGGPYTLVLSEARWLEMLRVSDGYPVLKHINAITGGKVVINRTTETSFLLSGRGGDYELVIGQDASCGFEGARDGKVRLYLSESFTFRVLSPEAVIVFE
ncbi:MAG: bacteriocin family protein [Bacteroidales bacterium]|jgi:uncharacterized linocin/CFP29 family protein|nr:bacteriocin family protein [Bacteroidales bacterium]